jgi:hypothetical protein
MIDYFNELCIYVSYKISHKLCQKGLRQERKFLVVFSVIPKSGFYKIEISLFS